jgi:hypothetical protein
LAWFSSHIGQIVAALFYVVAGFSL